MSETITDNKALGRYELVENGHTVFANYKIDGGTLFVNYVEAPGALRGTGAAGRLMECVAQKARAGNLKILPICGYAASWLRRHPEYDDLKT